MLEDMSKEDLIIEVKRLRGEVYHLKMALPSTTPRPDGYAIPATRPVSEAPVGWALPEDRSGQIPSSPLTGWPKNFGKPWLGAVFDSVPQEEVNEMLSSAKEKIEEFIDKIKVDQKKAEEADLKEYSGWCMRITEMEGLKFLFLKSPEGNSFSLPIDYSSEVFGISNMPMVLFQFANAIGTKDIPGVWPRWWKLDRNEERFIISRRGLSYTITPKFARQEKLLVDFFEHLNTIRVPSIDEADGA